MRRRNIALVAIPFLMLTSCSIYNHFVERGVCQQFKDANHPIIGSNPDIDPVEFFGKDSEMNLAKIVQTKCAKYIELP